MSKQMKEQSSGTLGGPDGLDKPAASESEFSGILVSWSRDSTAEERARSRGTLGLTLREKIYTEAMKYSGSGVVEWLDLPDGVTASQAIKHLSKQPGIAFVEKNWKLQAQATSNDPYYSNGRLWGMYGDASNPANPYGSQAAEAWSEGNIGSSDVFVGIIDEGYQYTHPDLINNAGVNPGEIPGNGRDDDENGYVDDVYGWNFANDNNTVYGGPRDDHGTHVAGTIGAKGGNSTGVAGVNWNIKMLSGKFLGRLSGTSADAIKAVDYFTDLKNSGVNIVATNNSWGGGGYSQGLFEAIQRANAADILFIAAAGNEGRNNDSRDSYPSSYDSPNVIAVASITSTGARSSFSNYGSTTVDLGAPGSDIESTLPENTYGSYSGTSMATPHVTGAAALLSSIVPSATGAQIKQALLESAAPTPSLSGITVTGGRLDIQQAIDRLKAITGVGGTDYWGTPGSDSVNGDDKSNRIAGVTKFGDDNGANTVDTLTGGTGSDTFILADARRGTFYDDGLTRTRGIKDYAIITDLVIGEGDRIRLQGQSQYLIRNEGSNTYLFLGNGDNQLSKADEFIAGIQGVNLARGSGFSIVEPSETWVAFF